MNPSASSGSVTYKIPASNGNGLRRNFGPDGCPAVVDGTRCGETKNLQIIKEFKRLYEDKMKQIDDIAGGDCIQAKVNLQQEWIKDLTDQNELLVRVVEELEIEAAERVTLLEKKLQQSAKSAGEVMDSYRDFSINFLGDLQKMEQVQNDMNNLIELIRRAQNTGTWNTDGLQFYCFNINDVIRPNQTRSFLSGGFDSMKKEDLLKEQERRIKDLEAQLFSGKSPQEFDSLRKEYKELEQSMLDMRDALTAEVADKHDTILCLRREVHMLEEQCRKADQQTNFKDNIIKELRKEIKQLKQQQEAGDSLQVALPHEFITRDVPVHLRTYCSKSLPLRIEYVDKEVQTSYCSLNTPNWMGIVNDIVERTEHEKTLIAALESECKNLVKQLSNKDKYIFDQNDLIVLLVQKLYVVYRTLRDLEEKTNTMSSDDESERIKLKEAVLDIKNQLALMKERADACATERDSYKKQFEQTREEIEKINKDQETNIKELKNRLQEKLQENEELKSMLKDTFEENQNLKEELEQQTSELKHKLKASKEELETLRKDYANGTENLKKQLNLNKCHVDTLKQMEQNTKDQDYQSKLKKYESEIATLKKEKERLEKSQCNNIDFVQSDMLKELETCEQQHNETLNQLDQLRRELEKTKIEHKLCMDKIRDLGEENTILKEQFLQPTSNKEGVYCRPCVATSTDFPEDVTSSCPSVDVSVNTDTTWTGIMGCEELEYVSVAVNTVSVNCRDFGISPGRLQSTPTVSNGVQCTCSKVKLKDRQQMDVFTSVSCYTDPNEADGDDGNDADDDEEQDEDVGEVNLGVTTDLNNPKVLELLKLKKLEVVEPNEDIKRAIRQSTQRNVALCAGVPRQQLERLLNEDVRLRYERRRTQEPLNNDLINIDEREELASIPCSYPPISGKTREYKRLTFALSSPVRGRGRCDDVHAIRGRSPQNQVFYPPPTPPSHSPLKSSLKCPCNSRNTQNQLIPQNQRVLQNQLVPQSHVVLQHQRPRKSYNHVQCQTSIKQQDVSVNARPIRTLLPSKTHVMRLSSSVITVETGTSMDNDDLRRTGEDVKSLETDSSCATTDSVDSYEDTVLSRSKDHVIYVRQSNPTQDLETVVHDLNLSVSRIVQMAPEIDAKEKIARLEEQLRTALKQKEQAVEYERLRRNQEVENLKLTIEHMESAIKNKQTNSENLQSAVDLYSDSIAVLEQSKLNYETQITQQQITITNLQDALVITKKELEDLRIKFKQDHDHKCDLLNILDIGVHDLEDMCLHYYNQLTSLRDVIEGLRDENLNLEVIKFEMTQDKEVLESTLSKYQQEKQQLIEFVTTLKEEINRLKYENHSDSLKIAKLKNEIAFYVNQAIEVKTIMKHILGIGDTESPTLDPEATENLTLTAQEVERFVQALQSQINLILASLEREQNVSQVNAGRIDELQNILSIKSMELARSIEMYQDLKVKLESYALRNKKLEEAVVELQDQLADTELDQQFQEQKVDICHDELDICLTNLNSVKMKLRQQCQMMTQKIEELTELKADFQKQNNTLEVYKRDLEATRVRYSDEVLELKRVIRELTDKLNNSETKVVELNEELKNVEDIIMNMTQREGKYQQELAAKEQDFNNKLQVWKVKEARLIDQISQLEQQLRTVHNELAGRTHQIDSAKNKLQQISNDAHMRVQMGQEELLAAKNEINILRQVHEKLQIENDTLHQTVRSLKVTLAQYETRNMTVKQQLDKCMCDLQKIESDKYYVEQKNEKLVQELDKMQSLIRNRCESMMTLEEEMNDLRSNRDNMQRESQHVICNVRSWLEEQKRINDQLKDKLVKKNALIIKYQQASPSSKHLNVKKSLPPVCAEVCNRTVPRQRGGTVPSRMFSNALLKRRGSPQRMWSLNSRGSDTDSPRTSICSDSADWFDIDASETTAPFDEPGTEVWIHRVESMTEELERSNRYWKKKISDSEFMVTKDK